MKTRSAASHSFNDLISRAANEIAVRNFNEHQHFQGIDHHLKDLPSPGEWS
jgi:hypothetical protein